MTDEKPHDRVRYRSGCRCDTCRIDRRNEDREKAAARWVKVAAEHAKTGARPKRCLCTTCKADRGPTRVRRRKGENTPPPTQEVPAGLKSVVCCEREAFEIEGSGHDWDCPRVVAA